MVFEFLMNYQAVASDDLPLALANLPLALASGKAI
jgi:hypothetical protein